MFCPKSIFIQTLLIIWTFYSTECLGQVTVSLEPDYVSGTDTVWVDVRITGRSDSSWESVWAFQFRVVTESNLRFLGSSSAFTRSDKIGWNTDYNSKNGLVGGYSAMDNGIFEEGVLIRLQFLAIGTDTYDYITLQEFKLNTGNPDHFPAVPSLRLDLSKHLE